MRTTLFRSLLIAAVLAATVPACGTDGTSPPPPAACSELTLAPLALSTSFCVTHRVTLSATPAAIALRGTTLYVFSGKDKAFELQRYALTAAQTLGPAQAVFSFNAAAAATSPFAGGFLAVSAAADPQLAVGYTWGFPDTKGEVYRGKAGATPSVLSSADANFDALFLDEDWLLVNGKGLGAAKQGTAVYAARAGQTVQLFRDLGQTPGFVAASTRVFYAGGYTQGGTSGKNDVYGYARTAVEAALREGRTLGPRDGTQLVTSSELLDVAALDEGLALLRVTFDSKGQAEFQGLDLLPVSDALGKQAVVQVVSPGGTATINALASDGPSLALLLIGPNNKTDVAVIRRK